jgi:transmembrane sensor
MPTVNEEAVNDQAAPQAAYWLATLMDESCSEAERQQFFEWLRGSTRNVEEFLRLSTLARRAQRRELWPDRSIESLLADARAGANVTGLHGGALGRQGATRHKARSWAIAASMLMLLGAGTLLYATGRLGDLLTPGYSTQVGEQRLITLDDGTIVELNSKSHLRTRYTKTLRAVELTDGEAIFRVMKDPQRPFRVRAGTTDIVAVGTAFNVNASETRTVVTVLEGRVRVKHRPPSRRADGESANVELAVGEQLIVSGNRSVVKLALRDTQKVTSWTQQRLIFEETPLSTAAAEFSRYSPRAIRIEDVRLGERRINGVFDATDPASLVEFLRSDETVDVSEQNGGWTLRSRP